MGPMLPEKLRGTSATLGALSLLTTVLRCYVRIRAVKAWGWDDSIMIVAFILHMWYTETILTGIHYGTGRRTADISVSDSVHAMRCWWLCFLAYASTVTFAKISAGFFFLRISGVMTFYRIATYIITIFAAAAGFVFFFFSLFQCSPIEFFWTRLVGANGSCISMDIMIVMTYLYGSIALATDVALGLLLVILVWNLNVDRRTKLFIAPLLAMTCIASYAALVRMPYIENFKKDDFLYSTVDISLWSTVEVGISVVAGNLATLRPLIGRISEVAYSLRSLVSGQTDTPQQDSSYDIQENVPGKSHVIAGHYAIEGDDIEKDASSTVSLTSMIRDKR